MVQGIVAEEKVAGAGHSNHETRISHRRRVFRLIVLGLIFVALLTRLEDTEGTD